MSLILTQENRSQLLSAAKNAASRAYCPYSRFRVGAAVLTDRGEIFAGCNVENASYGLTICAERNAIFQAVGASGVERPLRLRGVLVYTPTPTPTAPCGACRQVINEFGADCEIVCVCDGVEAIHVSLGSLLPHAFGPRNLNG
jgi:cytidine deaminase